MDKDALWNTFAHSGKIEDYLRYRGVNLAEPPTGEKEGMGHGHRPQTASDDRRPDPAGV